MIISIDDAVYVNELVLVGQITRIHAMRINDIGCIEIDYK